MSEPETSGAALAEGYRDKVTAERILTPEDEDAIASVLGERNDHGTWFSADLHLGHRNIIDYCARPFASVDEMNQELVSRWNERVQPGDDVFVIGDLALGKIVDSLALASQLVGRKWLVPGNHDRCWPGHSKVGARQLSMYIEAGFEIIAPQVWHTPKGMPPRSAVTLCHFPFAGDSHDDDRFTAWRPMNEGQWLLHGHVHDAWKINGRQINVGVDVWDYAPVSEGQIMELIAGDRT